jgi:hypothetical protein
MIHRGVERSAPMRFRPAGLRALLSTAILAGTLLGTARGQATETYVGYLKSYWRPRKPLKVPGTKGCQLCHSSDSGGVKTAIQPFASTLRGLRLTGGGNTAALKAALDQDYARRADSDRDGVTDYQEIVTDGTNPNDARSLVVPEPVSGNEGGQGGQWGAGGSGDDGGAGESPPVAPAFVPPSAADLPPPFVHGCGVASSGAGDGLVELLPAAVGLLFARARRRRSHRSHRRRQR